MTHYPESRLGRIRRSYRKWWQPPRRTIDRLFERRVTYLELFYDLVYVVLVAELAHSLATNPTLAGTVGFAFLFVIVGWAWFNGTAYFELHGNNDIRTRVFTFLQMFTVAAMAVFAHDALGAGSVGFALSYAAFQLILTYMWWRTGVHDPEHRPLTRPYMIVFTFSVLLYVVSVFVEPPWRFVLWGVALTLSLLAPIYSQHRVHKNPELLPELERSRMATPALVERFGLFTIIVLGEVVAGTIRGVAGQPQLTWVLGIAAGLGMLVAIGMWWLYFDFLAARQPLPDFGHTMRWYFLHLPMTMGIAATGAAVFNIVEHSGQTLTAEVRWLLVGSIALTLICIALLMRTIVLRPDYVSLYRSGKTITSIAAVVALIMGLTNLAAVPLLLVMVLLLFGTIAYGMLAWIKVLGAEPIDMTWAEL